MSQSTLSIRGWGVVFKPFQIKECDFETVSTLRIIGHNKERDETNKVYLLGKWAKG